MSYNNYIGFTKHKDMIIVSLRDADSDKVFVSKDFPLDKIWDALEYAQGIWDTDEVEYGLIPSGFKHETK